MIQLIEIVIVLVAVAVNFFISWIVVARRRALLSNLLFAVISFWFGLWGLCLLLYEYPLFFTHLFWLQGAYLSATGMELFIVGFALHFPQPVFKKIWKFIIAYGVSFSLVTIYGLYFTHDWIQKITTTSKEGLQASIGSFYIFWTLGEWVLIIISVIALVYSYKRAIGVIKTQLYYLIWGFFLFGILVNIPDVIAPLFFHTSQFFAISSVLSLIFTGTASYIILRHRFMDLHRVIRLFSFYILSILFVGAIYFAIVYAIGIFIFPHWFHPEYTLIAIYIILILRYVTYSKRQSIQKKLKKIFIHGFYEKEDVLQKLISIATENATNLKTMIEKSLEVTYESFFPSFIIGASTHEGKLVTFRVKTELNIQLHPFTADEVSCMNEIESIVITSELTTGKVKNFLESRHIAVVLPFHSGGWMRFMFFGEKQSNDAYFTYDIETLELIQPILRLMAQQGRQVEQIRLFNKQLSEEIKRATDKLRKTNASLKVADALKDEFISIASHELKTPTTAIQGFLWLVLQKDTALSAYSRDKLEKVTKLTDNITTLVNDMLDVSKIESERIKLHPEKFDIVQLAEEVKGELDIIAIQKQIQIIVTKNKSFYVWADRQRIHQVISNLLNNAVKFTNKKGKIHISFKEKKRAIEVHIADTGIGIPKEDMQKLFTKFGKLENGNSISSHLPGTGLGLYIVKNFIELSGGKIEAHSLLGKGSTFVFSLPSK